MVFNESDQELRDLSYKIHAFSMVFSNLLGYNRDLPATRNAACKENLYLTDVSVTGDIICLCSEPVLVLLRMVSSYRRHTSMSSS